MKKAGLIDKSTHYNVIKVLTMILVVFAHAGRMYTGDGVVTPINQSHLICSLTEYIYGFHMPLFLAASGMVYGLCIDDLGKYKEPLPFIKNKAVRLLIPYLFFGLAVVATTMVFFGFSDKSYLEYCIDGIILAKNCRHLWYILVLFEIFLICTLAKNALQKTFTIPIITLLLLVASYFSSEVTVVFHLGNLCNYAIYFYLGYLLNRYYEKVIKILKNPISMIIFLAASILLKDSEIWVLRLILGLSGCAFAIGLTKYFPEFLTKTKLFIKANKNGFGIYLFHPMIVYITFCFFGDKNINAILLCLFVTAFAYILSWLLTVLFRKIRLGVLIGE